MTTAPITPLLGVGDVAKFFGVTPYTVRRWLADGELRSYKVCGSIRVRREDVDALLKKSEQRVSA